MTIDELRLMPFGSFGYDVSLGIEASALVALMRRRLCRDNNFREHEYRVPGGGMNQSPEFWLP